MKIVDRIVILLFIIIPLVGFCQENIKSLQVKYVKNDGGYIYEINKKSGEKAELEIKSEEYIEFINPDYFDTVIERYSLTHRDYNSDSLKIGFNYNSVERIEFVNFENSNISYIDLSALKLKEFPVSITNIKGLKYLEIMNDDFEVLPEEISRLKNLEKVKFGHTRIKKLPHSFKELKKLSYLNINYPAIEDKEYFFDVLNKMKNLKSLELWSVGFQDKLPKNFLHLKGLKELILSGSDFDFSLVYRYKKLKLLEVNLTVFESFKDSIKELKNLETLKISRSSKIGNLPDEIIHLKKLKHLEIDYGLGNAFGYTIETKNTYEIIQSFRKLEKLYLGKYFDEIYPFWLNPNLKYFYFSGSYSLPEVENLKLIKNKIIVDADWKCHQMNKVNQNIICK